MGRGVCQVLKETGCDRTRVDCPLKHYSLQFHLNAHRKGKLSMAQRESLKEAGVLKTLFFHVFNSHLCK